MPLTGVGVLSPGLFGGAGHGPQSLLLVDGFPEGLGHLCALQPVDHLC